MLDEQGKVIDTDVLVIGGGAGGQWAALSAKRHAPAARVTLLDARMVGRTGHTAFSNAWMVVVTPEDDLEACTRDVIEGNEWVADQPLIHEVLELSHRQMLDLEKMGLHFPKENGRFVRRPTRGLRVTKVMHPDGGGLEMCWKFREALLREGVELAERIFVTDLLRDRDGGVAGAVGIDGRTGEFQVVKARATIIATNSVTFRSGFVRDITGTGPLLAYRAGATLTNAEFGYLRPGTPKFYFEGITFAIQDGARFVNAQGEPFMEKYSEGWSDQADVQVIARAMIEEKRAGRAPVYLDMSRIPAGKREEYFHSTVAWMDYFFNKLDRRVKIDMFDRTPYYPLYQMTKMGIRTDSRCCSEVPGLFAAGLAQAGCATHFAGFHIGMCNGTGWIAGRSAARFLEERGEVGIEEEQVRRCRQSVKAKLDATVEVKDDKLLREFQKLVFRYDVSVLKHEARLSAALDRLASLRARCRALKSPHVHSLVRLEETECMMDATVLILQASRMRTESRLNHMREDFPERDDLHWLKWILIRQEQGKPRLWTEPIPTPIHPCPGARPAAQ